MKEVQVNATTSCSWNCSCRCQWRTAKFEDECIALCERIAWKLAALDLYFNGRGRVVSSLRCRYVRVLSVRHCWIMIVPFLFSPAWEIAKLLPATKFQPTGRYLTTSWWGSHPYFTVNSRPNKRPKLQMSRADKQSKLQTNGLNCRRANKQPKLQTSRKLPKLQTSKQTA